VEDTNYYLKFYNLAIINYTIRRVICICKTKLETENVQTIAMIIDIKQYQKMQ